ncbi:hypothetical protein DFQ30_000390 [Apophysomyces sp. BC1015]|nr:hypothetical protein DFQ30_000390 [Apophysomyces sp. BC1015]KAG0178126.1 hypothetical protein DFQ29_003881 [Apophysomyces sp. BC1021]
MKFGNYLDERKAHLPSEYAANCIDYKTLKHLLKTTVYAHSIKIEPSEQSQQPFSEVVSLRLGQLQQVEAAFIRQLDAQVHKACAFFEKESARLVAESAISDMDLLQKILTLERFVFLNYTGITKILKKNDRHSGLSLSEPYLHRVAKLPLVQAKELTQLKQRIMTSLNEADVLAHPVSPIMARSRSQAKLTRSNVFPPALVGPNQKVLVSLAGPHGTDIIGAVLECLARHPCTIDDFMLSRLYHNVTFGVLLTLGSDNVNIFRDLADAAHKWDASLTFDVPDTQAIEPTVRHQTPTQNRPLNAVPTSLEEAPYAGRIKYAASILNQDGLDSAFLRDWTQFLLKNHISVEKLSRLNLDDSKLSCADVRLSVPNGVDVDALRADLIALSASHNTDVALQPDDVFRKNKRLVVFDMDSTLIRQEVIDEIAKYAGVVDQVAAITEAAMNGEIDFKESLRRRVSLLSGTNVNVLEAVKQNLTFTEGAHFLCRALKKLGFKLAVISGGFMPLALYVKAELGLDYAFANQLKVSPDGLTFTGETTGPIVDGVRKAELLDVIAQAEGVTLNQVIAVGDGANDLWMLNKAGLGIAFNAKPRVQEQARARINQKSLKYVLTLLGYSEKDMEQLELKLVIISSDASLPARDESQMEYAEALPIVPAEDAPKSPLSPVLPTEITNVDLNTTDHERKTKEKIDTEKKPLDKENAYHHHHIPSTGEAETAKDQHQLVKQEEDIRNALPSPPSSLGPHSPNSPTFKPVNCKRKSDEASIQGGEEKQTKTVRLDDSGRRPDPSPADDLALEQHSSIKDDSTASSEPPIWCRRCGVTESVRWRYGPVGKST